jgi:hypothetical protein
MTRPAETLDAALDALEREADTEANEHAYLLEREEHEHRRAAREAACAYWHEAGVWCSKCGTTPKKSTSSLADLRELVRKNNGGEK